MSFARATQGSTPSYKMMWDGRTGAMLSTHSDIPDPTGQNEDSISDTSFTYDQAGRMLNESQAVSPGFSPGSIARTYDDENHTITSTASETTNDGKSFFEQSIAAYDWGANGHPVRIGSATGASNGPAPTSVPQSQYETLHWDGDQLIFTSNANGQVDDIKIGAGGDITPLDPSFTGITFWDRGPTGAIQYGHNINGTGGNPNLAPTPSSNALIAPAGQIGPTSFLWTDGSQGANYGKLHISTRVVGIGQGRLLGMFRTDGITDGFNTIQGVRTEDSTAGTWTTPDAYAGDVHDPASQKSYMWNNNNAVAYGDPSGYDAHLYYDANDIDTGNPTYTTTSTLKVESADGSMSGEYIAAANTPSSGGKPYDNAEKGTQVYVPGTDTATFKDKDSAAKAAEAAYGGLVSKREIGCTIYCNSGGCHYGPATIGDDHNTSVDLSPYKGLDVAAWHQHPVGDGLDSLGLHARDAGNAFVAYPWLRQPYSIYTDGIPIKPPMIGGEFRLFR